ncbi:hypothetical protein CANCADRAFT_4554 [Tortispora caseinolytica NRRL Y-17796]|uniref:Vesicular-fusion protein SEC17 n=1 Tax=Tortispora caseinolytica NRRL Y-17796 TaxID=767744 RepID=A0A1E4T9G2_9ASCO|nr:hypothetical protein CANCADRAFT_4554 [Tortispora caseinolytica NRRL Y-17796]
MSRAQALLEQANKKYGGGTKGGFLSSIFGSDSSRIEEAADLYVQAANAFRLERKYNDAGLTFEKAAEAQGSSELRDEAANTLVEAYKCYRQSSAPDAARVLGRAIQLFTERGQFRRAANYKQDLAALYETELGDLEQAVMCYEDAGEWFAGDGADALANKAFLKAADLAALNENYASALKLYNKVAKASIDNPLTKWSLKDYFLKAVICNLANQDVIAAKKALDTYCDMDNGFAATREFGLAKAIIAAVEDGDQDKFTEELKKFDSFSQLDKWKTTMLLRIKNAIVNEDDNLT